MNIDEMKRLCPEFAEAIQTFEDCNLPTEHEAADEAARVNFLAMAKALAEARQALEKSEKFILAHEQWEGQMIEDSNVWNCDTDGFPVVLQNHYDHWIEGPNSVQNLRNEAKAALPIPTPPSVKEGEF